LRINTLGLGLLRKFLDTPTIIRNIGISLYKYREEVGVWMYKLGMISQERLKIEVKLLLSARMPRRLAQQRMRLSDLEWPFHASRAISVV